MGTSIESALAGRRVESLRGGGRLTVVLSGGLVLTVWNDFRLRSAALGADQPGTVEHFFPGLGTQPSRRLAGLAGARVETVRVSQAGGLELGFTGGRLVCVPPDPPDSSGPAQAWQVSGPGGPLFTARPGGYLTGGRLTGDHARG